VTADNVVTAETEVLATTRRLYAAIEDMVCGRGVDGLKAVWHHGPEVTSGHPIGSWAHGWDEILVTWEVFATIGRESNAGSSIKELRAQVFGDVAYTTCVFVAGPVFGSISLNCTNVLRRIDGEWKIVHHHADRAQSMEANMEQLAAEG
jgi:ketosteroid isomerase-like protein